MPPDPVAAVLREARAAWPGVALDDTTYTAHLAAAAERGGATVEEWLLRGTGGDLFLACACLHGDSAALAAFDRVHLAGVDAALGRLDIPAAIADDAKQEVRRLLLVGDGTRPPRIGDYTGAGDLRGWLRVVAVRAALEILRRGARETPLGTDLLEAMPATGANLELDFLKTQYREHFRAAFLDALAALTPRERTLLRQQFLFDLSIDQIGAVYHVHRATAARWLNRCHEKLLTDTRRRLAARLKVDRGEVDSILRLIRSQLDVSVRRYLQPED